MPPRINVYQHHGDEVEELPEGFRVLARSATSAIQAIAYPGRRWWGTQFHPEAFTAEYPAGERILRNFPAGVPPRAGVPAVQARGGPIPSSLEPLRELIRSGELGAFVV